MRYKAMNSNCISRPITEVTNLTCFEFHFTFFKSISVCEFVYFEMFICLILLCKLANIGADLPVPWVPMYPEAKGRWEHARRGKIVTDTTQVEKCIHCGQLILRKMSKIGATRCQI